MRTPRVNPPELSEKHIQRIWNYIDQSMGQGPKGDCWEWQSGRFKFGHGYICFRKNKKTLTCLVTRIIFYLITGRWPLLNILHSCDNPPCCNPTHLREGSQAENMADMVARNRQAKGDKHSFRLHPEIVRRGEESNFAKLTENAVRGIREDYAANPMPFARFGSKHDISNSQAYNIIRRKQWTHI